MIKIINGGDGEQIFSRVISKVNVEETVGSIIKDVKERGDKALLEYTLKFDKADLKSLRVTEDEIIKAVNSVEPKFIEILKRSAKNIRSFCEKQVRTGFEMVNADGATVGQKVVPLDSAGLYVPGGTASYPSTVLMDAIPALVAGVKRVVMVSPPDKNGNINPVILASAFVAGVNEIYKVGGAQAIAGLAYGTESLPKVDKIIGPGNAFVAEATKQVFGQVSIDMIAGPSEIMVVADGKNNPAHVASDLLSQAEHDKMASAVLITDDGTFARAVAEEIEKQIPELERAEIARAS
ncbi:MAG: histidinol dehydrogenase, partial [Clostridia bacterium]|nr:histidinol dehydrogenase [Clostridia bacterium]